MFLGYTLAPRARFEEEAYWDIVDRSGVACPGRNDPKMNDSELFRAWFCDESDVR